MYSRDTGNTIGRLFGPVSTSDARAEDANPPIVAETPEEAAWIASLLDSGHTGVFETDVVEFDPRRSTGMAKMRPAAARKPDAFTDGARVPARRVGYDEQYILCDGYGRPLVNVRYRVCIDSNVVASGVTDLQGMTQRIATQAARRLTLEISGGNL